jgi:preprotein translocase SecE subunit
MAKTRAQRKAERRAREAEERKRSAEGRDSTARAQHDTQVPKSGDEAIIEAEELGIAAGASEEALALPEHTKPSRSERRAEARSQKESEKRQRGEQKRRETQLLEKKQKQAKAERAQRGGVIGFLLSCWAELKKVQWPDRETLIQATAVTIIFVAVAAAFLGALDALFNEIVKQIL